MVNNFLKINVPELCYDCYWEIFLISNLLESNWKLNDLFSCLLCFDSVESVSVTCRRFN